MRKNTQMLSVSMALTCEVEKISAASDTKIFCALIYGHKASPSKERNQKFSFLSLSRRNNFLLVLFFYGPRKCAVDSAVSLMPSSRILGSEI